MLSSNPAPSTSKPSRAQHRRQQSTPSMPVPTNPRPPTRHRPGMSLDLQAPDPEMGFDWSSNSLPQFQESVFALPSNHPAQDPPVSHTNTGQASQHDVQVAQSHSQSQPGTQHSSLQSPTQSSFRSFPSPHTPRMALPSPTAAQSSPSRRRPVMHQLRELNQQLQQDYGPAAELLIKIPPSSPCPSGSPGKQSFSQGHGPLDSAPLPSDLGDIPGLDLDHQVEGSSFPLDESEQDWTCDNSSYLPSDAAPTPFRELSPHQFGHTYLDDIKEEDLSDVHDAHVPHPLLAQTGSQHDLDSPAFLQQLEDGATGQLTIPQHQHLPPAVISPFAVNPSHQVPDQSQSLGFDLDTSIASTGISPEEVQRYMGQQDPKTGKWSCLYDGCDKTFGRRENIRSHIQTHLGDRQYRCPECKKCFVRQHDLKRHAKIHSGAKPYRCRCGNGFARQDALTRHRQRGMCVGGFPDAVRRQGKRGRPRKARPDDDERAEKAKKTRRKMAAAASADSTVLPPTPDGPTGNHAPALPEDKFEVSAELSNLGDLDDLLGSSTNPFSARS